MTRLSHALVWVLLVIIIGLAATTDTRADALRAVQVIREGGCGGIVPAAKPLYHNALLDRIAQAWASGRALSVAAEQGGYRPEFTTGLRVSGPDSSMLEVLRRSGCATAASQAMREVGIYQHGLDAWLVFVSAYALPPSPPTTPWVPLPASPPPVAPTPASRAPLLSTRALQLVNEARARGTRCGTRAFAPVPPVTLSETLAGVALGHATDMAAHNYFEHENLWGQSPADRVRAVGYPEKRVGENIAYGPKSIEEAVQGWLDSPAHCENIMDPRFAEMGIAYAAGQTSRRGLYWVQLLAEPRA